jgi:tetratricopeptide (TPR) repeat protein
MMGGQQSLCCLGSSMPRAFRGGFSSALATAIAVATGLVAHSVPAVAQDNETLTRLNKSCTQVQGDESLNACTRLINSGKYSGQGLAILYYNRGIIYFNRNDYASAVREYSASISADPSYQMSWHQRANTQIRLRNYDAAIRDEDQAIRLNPKDHTAYHNRGVAFFFKSDYDRAIADFDQSLRLKPDHVPAFRDRANSFFRKEMYDRALVDQDEAIRLAPNDYDGYHRRGLTWLWKADLDKAVSDFDRAIRMNGTVAAVWRDRGNAYFRKNLYDRALADQNESIRLDPRDPLAYHHRGVTYFFKEDYDRAITDFTEVVRVEPSNGTAWRDRGNSWFRKKDYDKALADYDAAIRANPTYADAHESRGVMFTYKNDYPKAIAAYDEAIRLNPKLTRAFANRAAAREHVGDLNGAYRDSVEALALNASDETAKAVRDRVRSKLANPGQDDPSQKKLAIAPIDPKVDKPQEKVPDQPVVATGSRVALVIGNGDYRFATKLTNPTNDAGDIAAKLRQLGFDVVEGRNLDRSGMDGKIREFSRKLDNASLALFFYAGHGMQVGGKNYLVPVDAKLERPGDLNLDAVDVSLVLQQMEAERRVNLIFLDACRDNPLARSFARSLGTRSTAVGQGLASIQSAVGTMIVYATQPDNVALDGEGRNSPFTSALLKHMGTPGLEIDSMMKRVRSDVLVATRDKQVPWNHSSLIGEVFLATR